MEETNDGAIAVVGMACRFPESPDLDSLWQNLIGGREGVRFFADDELEPVWRNQVDLNDPNVVRAAAILDDIDRFDRHLFGLSEAEAEATDPQHRLFLECAWEALEDAGWGDVETFGGVISVYAGAWMSSYANRLRGLRSGQRGEFSVWSGNGVDFLPTVTSYRLHLNGESFAVQSACSTSMVAIHLACESLLAGRSDLVLAGGASVDPLQRVGYSFEEGGLLSPDGHTRAFDAKGAGTIRGHGVGIAALRRLDDALEEGDPIYAVIRATSASNDGNRKAGFVAPSIEGMSEAAAAALAIADLDPNTVEFVEMHGGGTLLGDAIEFEAIRRAYGSDAAGRCGIGSVKSNFGDMIQAAGIAGFIKTVLSIHHGMIPPSLNHEQSNPDMNLEDGRWYVVDEPTAWSSDKRRAGISSSGVGGTNVHAILEAPPTRTPNPGVGAVAIPLSAQSPQALGAMRRNLSAWLVDHPDADLHQVARTLQRGRSAFAHRFVWLGKDALLLRQALDDAGVGADVIGEADGALLETASAWLEGNVVEWDDDDRVQCVSLPTYPFQRESYWIDASGGYEGPAPAFACWAGHPMS